MGKNFSKPSTVTRQTPGGHRLIDQSGQRNAACPEAVNLGPVALEEPEAQTTTQLINANDKQMLTYQPPDSGKSGLESPFDSYDGDDFPSAPSSGKDQGQLDTRSVESALIDSLSSDAEEQVFEKVTINNRLVLRITSPVLIMELLHRCKRGSPDGYRFTQEQLATVHELNKLPVRDRHISDASQHAKLALDFIKSTQADPDIQISDRSKISFDQLHLLYPRRSTVYAKDDGGWRAYKVDRVELGDQSGSESLHIHAFYLDFDKSGRYLVPHLEVFSVSKYFPARQVRSLELVPDWYILKTCPSLIPELRRRGEGFWKYKNEPVCQEYTGDAWSKTQDACPLRVIIDHSTSSKHNQSGTKAGLNGRSCAACLGKNLDLGPYPASLGHDPDVCIGNRDTPERSGESGSDVDKLLMFCPSSVCAFSLRHRTWKMVKLRDLKDVEYRTVDQKQLYLKGEHTETLEALVATFFPDGKNKTPRQYGGHNILLQGETGTGKTFVVEYLAEKYERPLYSVDCGYLGTEPDVLEERLHEVLLRAANWGVILMLDGVNPFLRDSRMGLEDIRRAALLSVFRHQLRQSEALVFATASHTQRPDEEFLSCFVVHLGLPPLDFAWQQQIWRDTICSFNLPITQFEPFIKDLKGFCKGSPLLMNGRQIQSCVAAAFAVAKKKNETMKDSDIRRILELALEFRDYKGDTGRKMALNTFMQGSGT